MRAKLILLWTEREENTNVLLSICFLEVSVFFNVGPALLAHVIWKSFSISFHFIQIINKKNRPNICRIQVVNTLLGIVLDG